MTEKSIRNIQIPDGFFCTMNVWFQVYKYTFRTSHKTKLFGNNLTARANNL